MPQTRKRRSAQSSRPAPPPTQSDQFVNSTASDRKLTIKFVVIFIVISTASVLVYRSKYTSSNHRQPNLVGVDVNYQDILTEHSRVSENVSRREFTNPVLAYITPWNSKGYEIARKYTNKFTHLSPVWYNLKSVDNGLILEGRHNADKGWLFEIRKNGDALVLPRVVVEAFPIEIFIKKRVRDHVIELLVSECKDMEYDGIVLESWSWWQAYNILQDPDTRTRALQFIKKLGDALHSVSSRRSNTQNLQLIFVVSPARSGKFQPYDFGPEDLKSLGDAVDGFSLMTYDFSGPGNPGPNAPLKWVRQMLRLFLGASSNDARILANKTFLGINFYGNDFLLTRGASTVATVIGRDYISLLKKLEPKLQWEESSQEHFFLYVDDDDSEHAVFYPSLMSISLRLKEAQLWGTGISIWEIGQGLDYFFDLL